MVTESDIGSAFNSCTSVIMTAGKTSNQNYSHAPLDDGTSQPSNRQVSIITMCHLLLLTKSQQLLLVQTKISKTKQVVRHSRFTEQKQFDLF